jgi:hypothetical protein
MSPRNRSHQSIAGCRRKTSLILPFDSPRTAGSLRTKFREAKFWRRGELNRFASLIPRKLFILRSAKSAKSLQNAEVRYTAAIQDVRDYSRPV